MKRHFFMPMLAAILAFSPLMAQPPGQGAIPAELSWVPHDCAGFVHIKFAALWDSKIGADVRKAIQTVDPKALTEMQKELGLSLSQIESVTVLWPEAREHPGEEIVIRITTTAAYDRPRLLDALRAEPFREREDRPAKPGSIYRLKGRGLLHLSGERSLTLMPESDSAVGLLGKLLNRTSEGPLTPALKMASSDHHVVAALDITQLPEIPADEIPPDLLPLRDTRFVLIAGKLDADKAQLNARLSFGRPGLAEAGQKAVEEGRKLLIAQIEKELTELKADEKANRFQMVLLTEVKKTIADAKVETAGGAVQVSAQLAISESLTRLLAEGADSLKFASNRIESMNNLKQIGLAMHNYHDAHGSLPPAAICDANGKPLLSWRVAVLPYIEQDNLYKQFKLDEPWDSEHNKKLIGQMPKIYLLPGDSKKHEFPSTHYQVFVGNGAMFELRRGARFAQITDGLSNTFMVAEAESSVPWTKPDDIAYDPKKEPKLGYHFRSSCNALFGDGSVRAISKKVKPEILHLLIQRDDGQPIPALP